MDKESHLQTLQEMGFSRDQAAEALSAAGNDLTKAIAFLFGDEEPAGTGTQQSPFIVEDPPPSTQSSVNVSNPQDIPEFVRGYPSQAAAPDLPKAERPVFHGATSHHSDDDLENEESGSKSDTPEEPVALLKSDMDTSDSEISMANTLPPNQKTDLHTSPYVYSADYGTRCWVPLLHILSNYSWFAKRVLEAKSPSPFMQEVQRIVYFIQKFNDSKRWYVSTEGLAEKKTPGSPCGSYHDDEMVLNMIEHLMSEEPQLRPVFESMVESLDEEITKDLTVLEIESDSRSSTLYETLNELFWQKDFDFLGKIKYSSVAPVVIFQLVADEDSYSIPFQLSEVVYPEIYSDKATERIREEIASIKAAQQSYGSSSRRLMELNFFEGKKIDGLLKQTAKVLKQSDYVASQDIEELQRSVSKLRSEEITKQAQYKEEASSKRLRSFEPVIESLPDLRPYNLIGVIFSDFKYYTRTGDTWTEMNSGVTVDFECIKQSVERCTGAHLITLIYGDAEGCAPVALEEEKQDPEALISLDQGSRPSSRIADRQHEAQETSEITGADSPGAETYSSEPGTNFDTSSRVHEESGGREEESPSAMPLRDSARDATCIADANGLGRDSSGEIKVTQEAVKRPKWGTSRESMSTDPDLFKYSSMPSIPVKVKPHTIQQFEEDEKSVANADLG